MGRSHHSLKVGLKNHFNYTHMEITGITVAIPIVAIILTQIAKAWKKFPLNPEKKKHVRGFVILLIVIGNVGNLILNGEAITTAGLQGLGLDSSIQYLLAYFGYQATAK